MAERTKHIHAQRSFRFLAERHKTYSEQGPGVQTLDSAIHQINLYPADSVIDFCNTYPLDNYLSGG